MISDLFFNGKIKDVKEVLIYEEEFVLFYLNLQLKDVGIFSKEIVEEHLEKLYGKENIKNNGIIRFCDQHFKSKEKNYILEISEEEKDFYQKTQNYANDIVSLLTLDKKNLYNILENEILSSQISFVEKLKKCITYYYWNPELSFEKEIILLYKYFYILKNYYKVYRLIDSKLEKIPKLFNRLEIMELNITDEQLSFLVFNNVYTLKNLKYVPIDSLICIFCQDIPVFIEEINKYSIDKREVINKLYVQCNSILKPEWALVVEKRFDLKVNRKRSLKDIGDELNLTRERIRQIENKCIQKLLKNSKEIEKILSCFYKEIKQESVNFITLEELLNYVENEQLIKYLITIMNSQQLNIRFNEEYEIIYNNKEISIEQILDEARNKLKDIVSIVDSEECDKVQKYILNNDYKIYQEKIFVRKGINVSAIYINEIRENFSNGYSIGSMDDYNKLILLLTEKYGEIEIPSMHSIQAMIERADFIQIDRGTYKAREYTANLSEKIVEEIIGFIIQNSPVIPYNLIFEKFRVVLEKTGINNRFYLKGVLDEKLPEEFNTSRDFINTNTNDSITLYDIMPKIFKEFDAEFTIEDIKEKMPGLYDYNYENYIRAEEENGLIRVAPKTYIYIEKLNCEVKI